MVSPSYSDGEAWTWKEIYIYIRLFDGVYEPATAGFYSTWIAWQMLQQCSIVLVVSRYKNTHQSISNCRLISRLITEVHGKGTSISFPRYWAQWIFSGPASHVTRCELTHKRVFKLLQTADRHAWLTDQNTLQQSHRRKKALVKRTNRAIFKRRTCRVEYREEDANHKETLIGSRT